VTGRARIAVLDDYAQVATSVADWSPLTGRILRVSVIGRPFASEEEAVAALAPYQVIVAMRERTPFPASLLGRLPRLRLLVTTGMRNASIDLAAASDRGVLVCGTRGAGSPTSELAIGLIITLARDLPGQERALREGRWQTRPGLGLAGRKLGVVGLGKVGGAVARTALSLGMRVIAWSPNLTDERAAAAGARRAEKGELFERSDFVTLHLVLSARTRGIVGAADLTRMRPDAYLVNTARAGLVDQVALVQALATHRIAGAAIDVYEREPLPAGSPLLDLDNVILTPHLGYAPRDNFARMYEDAVEDIAAWLDGRPIRVLPGSADR
jgi:phosphoglycerate dehydrogenase-like enzyme